MNNTFFARVTRSNDVVELVEFQVSDDLKNKISLNDSLVECPICVRSLSSIEISFCFDFFNSLPVFWVKSKCGDVYISNRYDLVLSKVEEVTVDPVGFWELYLYESPLLSRSIYNEIKTSQAGHTLKITVDDVWLDQHFGFNYRTGVLGNKLVEKSHELLTESLRKNSNNNLVFPLSGGLDSRLLLAYSKPLDLKSTEFITYGFSPDILEYKYASQILRATYGESANHSFYKIIDYEYLSSVSSLQTSGGLIGVQNSHLQGFFRECGFLTGG